MNTENNIAIVCITDNGKNLAVKIQKKLKEGQIYFVKKKNNEEFNSITQKVKVENQNQTHNVRQEGIAPINQKR